jgi:hypothetical protein
MTDDPKAPGAAAVYLNIDETTDDNTHFHSIYARIKVLTEKGKELATVEIPYERNTFRVTNIEGRTIHSDGTIIPLAVKPEDLLSSKTVAKDGEHMQFNRTVFTLPNAEVGSILEYHYHLSYEDYTVSSPYWVIQRPYFVHKAHYSFLPFKAFLPGMLNSTSRIPLDEHGHPANNLVWVGKLPDGVSVKRADSSGRITVDVSDVPAAPEEESMPPVLSVLFKVSFYYKDASSASEFWVSEATLWSKDMDRFAEPSKALKETVAGLVAPADSELDKAKKLYKAVQALDNTDYSRIKSETERKRLNLKDVRHAQDIWNQKSGSSEEIALLYLAMLRAAGLTAYAEKVVDRQRSVFDPTYLSLNQLDDILVLSTGGKEIELDPGEKMCPFQTLSWRHSAAGGISQSAKGADTSTSASQIYSDNKVIRFGDVTLDGHGGLTGSFRIAMTGQEALYWRQLALTNDEAEVKKRFDRSLESILPGGVEGHVDHFAGLDDPYANLIAVVKAQGSLGEGTSKRVMLPAFFFETRAGHPFVAQEKRQTPVDMHYGETIIDQVAYHLPAGLTVEGAPEDANISWPQHTVFNTKTTVALGQVTVVRKLYRNFTFAKPEDYQDLRGFYQKVAASDQRELVLTTAPAAPKGN